VDAVASMLYLDYDRLPHEWVPNVYGDNRNLEAVAFFGKLNAAMREHAPDVLMIAEESTAWGNLTDTKNGGLGFSLKWNMGWMNDTLRYAALDPIYRKYHHTCVNFSLTYAFGERYVLPISHDEVVHGKRSLIERMPGTYAQKFAGVRVFLAYMMTHPGKKLLFMGCEIGQFREWDHTGEIEWFLLRYESHAALQHYVAALNQFYLQNPPLYECDRDWSGFRWIDADNADEGVVSYRRIDARGREIVVILNFTPVRRDHFRVGVPVHGEWREVFHSDAVEFGGEGICNDGALKSERIAWQNLPQSLSLTVPPLGAVFLKVAKRYEKTAKIKRKSNKEVRK
jgi:1,4-alpha-glucan branching enzyme